MSHELIPSMRLSRFVLTLFYLAGPLLIIWELFTPALSIPILLLSAAYVVVLFSLRRDGPADAKGWHASNLVAGFAHSLSASPGSITPALEASPFAVGIM